LEAPVEIGNTVVETIDVRPVDGKVVIGTFGKGAFSSTFTTTDANEDDLTPKGFVLEQNYPNPFNPTTTIKYSIPSVQNSLLGGVGGGFVTLKVYDILGKEVATLVNKELKTGNYEVKFDASNLSSGVYYYKMQTSYGFVATKKTMLLK